MEIVEGYGGVNALVGKRVSDHAMNEVLQGKQKIKLHKIELAGDSKLTVFKVGNKTVFFLVRGNLVAVGFCPLTKKKKVRFALPKKK